MEWRLGRYVVLKHLASGGMADVLLGRTDGIEGFERHVVLKRIRPEHSRDQRFIRMFLDEARVAANLHHQHIVQVHDIGESGGEFFLAMEYIHGEDVRSILSAASKRRTHVPLGIAVAIVSAAAAGLHYAHERQGSDKRPLGIVHRDISPSNILAGYDGSIKILDFGIAKAATRPDTRSGSLKGKISYMSPEQFKGGAVDRRSDVYSLGVVLYELATTTRLFKGESDYLVMEQIVNGRVSLPQVRRPDLPNELSAIIMRAISPDPERRYFTAEELRVALDQFAGKAGLTASTSALGAYMRKQFGERPEPWLELEAQGIYSFDDVQAQIDDASGPNNTWTELGRNEGRRSSGAIPRVTARGSTAPSNVASEAAAHDSGQLAAMRTPSSPTESKLGWENQQPAQSGLTPKKLALICAPLILLLGFALWRFAGTGTESGPVIAGQPAAPAQPAPPIVTPIPEPPRPAAPEPAVAVAPPPSETIRAPEPAPASRARERESPHERESRQAAAPAKRTPASTAKVVESAPVTTPEPIAKSNPAPAPAPTKSTPAAPALAMAEPAPLPALLIAPPPPIIAVPPPPPAPSTQVAVLTATPGPAATPAPAAPAPAVVAAPAQQNVAPLALDANRISGDKDIAPDAGTQTEINRSGLDKIVGNYKVCIAPDGSIATVAMLKTTGFASYDSKIQNTIRSKWRYRPYLVNGKAAQVCTSVMFIYVRK